MKNERLKTRVRSAGIFDPRVGFDGNALPSARFVSSNLVPDLDKPSSDLSLMTMTFAQFVDHDFNLTPVFTTRQLILSPNIFFQEFF